MSNIANPNPEKVIARTSECLRRLMEAGLTFEDLQLPIDDPKMRARLVRFWRSDGYESTADEKVARALGILVFGVPEAIQHFGIKPTPEQLATLANIPFSEGVLQECKGTHILVATFPLSILDIREKVKRELFCSHEDSWYNNEQFAQNKGEVGWHLVRKNVLPNSTDKTYADQQTLADTDETPSARVMVYTIIGHYLATGEQLFKNVYTRCAELGADGIRVLVGYFFAYGLGVYYYSDDYCGSWIGLAPARKRTLNA